MRRAPGRAVRASRAPRPVRIIAGMRRAFHIASAISLMLFVVAASLWGRSHVGGDELSFVCGAHRYVVRTVYGQALFESVEYTRPFYPQGPHWDASRGDAGALYRALALSDSFATR